MAPDLDLSSPEGGSVNYGINPDLCSLSYVSVDDAARAITESGRGSNLAKIDIKNAYRMIPVHPEDRLLLGMVHVGGRPLRRRDAPLRATVGSKDLHGRSKRTRMGDSTGRRREAVSLPGRLPNRGSAGIGPMRGGPAQAAKHL